MPRKPKGSSARFVHGGCESGPKIRPKGVVDGQQVNIPVLPLVGSRGRRRRLAERWLSVQGRKVCPCFFQGCKREKGREKMPEPMFEYQALRR
ncbi:30S ribosomal protein S11, chloroplastic [Quillaja saponaria]|uniref:30S ribosomal protein S11, chloroplastic n=1 Tax=Quillaja saponaria TaxID=32244 RepID=A0AAD7KKW0_QUISA|nr:30S ribosomal protein S11, chloroplastic [Quillaja saponaria]